MPKGGKRIAGPGKHLGRPPANPAPRSIRLDEHTAGQLAALATHAGQSSGMYLRRVIREMYAAQQQREGEE